MSVGQTSGRNTTNSAPAQNTNRPRVHWWRRMDYDSFERKISQFGIESARVGNKYIITSNNIRLEVSPIDFSGIVVADFDAMNEKISRWRQAKVNDDLLAYGATTGSLLDQSNAQGYMGSEQHTVWAMGASARTGCFIPPEFFFENEGFGGTAGNGPNVLPLGNTGEPMSTIAMAHDSDWMIGRLFSMGPLARLNTVTPHMQYQIQRMGSAGLFDGFQTNELFARDNRFPLISDPRTQQEREINARITSLLDAAGAQDTYYRENGIWLRQGRWGWNVKYTRAHAAFDFQVRWRSWLQIIGVSGTVYDFAPEYLWDGNESATRGKNDVRAHNDARAPGFPE